MKQAFLVNQTFSTNMICLFVSICNRCHDNSGKHASFSSYISRDKRKAWIDPDSCRFNFMQSEFYLQMSKHWQHVPRKAGTMSRKGVPCSVQTIWISFGMEETSIWQSTGSNSWYAFVNLEFIHTKLIIVAKQNIILFNNKVHL